MYVDAGRKRGNCKRADAPTWELQVGRFLVSEFRMTKDTPQTTNLKQAQKKVRGAIGEWHF